MIQSRCGILCNECKYKDEVGCAGCTNIDKPFWSDSCPVKDCCESRGYDHCGQCTNFPCGLLNGFAYDKEQGDNGKRIKTCRVWFAHEFMQNIASKNNERLKNYFAPDAVICWHDSNEQLTVDEFIKANCEFPSVWGVEVERVEHFDKGIVIAAQLNHPEDGYYYKYVSFVEFDNNKIQRLDEYYVAIEEIPEWRKAMNIGRPIRKRN